ncbi:Scavenger receptor class B member 1 [Halotydeus destructor]|nr:Scavenger receptor class B member 1 [Halotydeus destructor]
MALPGCMMNPIFHGILAFIFIILGVLSIFAPVMVKVISLDKQVKLKEDAMSYQYWEHSKGSKKTAVYFYSIDNPASFLAGGNPSLSQVGPVTYKVASRKEDVKFHGKNRVAYELKNVYTYSKQDSKVSESTLITTINAPLIFGLKLLLSLPRGSPYHDSLARNISFEAKKGILITKSIKQLLFDGYDSSLLTVMSKINSSLPDYRGKFSWHSELRGTSGSRIVAYTGKHDKDYINSLYAVNNRKSIPYWDVDSRCSNLDKVFNDETLVAPLKDSETIRFYLEHACRHLRFRNDDDWDKEEIEIGEYELKAKRYVLDKKNFMGAKGFKSNECYLSSQLSSRVYLGDEQGSLANGLIDAAPCHHGLPVIFSQPHFLDTAENVDQHVGGLLPERNLHQSFLDVFDDFGFVVRSAIRYQINIPTEYVKTLPAYKNVKSLIYPVMWIEDTDTMTEELAKKMWRWSKLSKTLGYSLGGATLVVGFVFLALAVLFYINGPAGGAGKRSVNTELPSMSTYSR